MAPACDVCGQRLPKFIDPRTREHLSRLTWKCSGCGSEVDKWGKLVKRAEPPKVPVNPLDEKGRTPLERVFEEE